jgi:hypothetical protein
MTDEERGAKFIEALANEVCKQGGVTVHHHYRPLKRCYLAGFITTCGALSALLLLKLVGVSTLIAIDTLP